MPHVRSKESSDRRAQRKAARKIMYDNSFQDKLNGEIVNLLRTEQVVDYLSCHFVGVVLSAVPCAAIEGCVLSDPYGDGAFQLVPKK
jgi:hypothetical protein